MSTTKGRILHVSPSFARRDGGPSEVLRNLPSVLTNRGYTISLATTDKGAERGEAADFPNAHIARARWPNSWTFSPSLVRPLSNLIAQADLVHIHSVNTFPTAAAIHLALHLKKPFIIEPHGAMDDYHWNQSRAQKELYTLLIERRAFQRSAGFIVSSEIEETGVRKRFAGALNPPQVLRLPLGVDDSLFSLESKSRLTELPSTILFLSRISHKKNLDKLLIAVSLSPLRDLDVRIRVAGPIDPSLRYDPRQLATQLGVADRVTFLGSVAGSSRSRELQKADLFVLASEDESFGVAPAEAMAAGCPVAVTERVGLAASASRESAVALISSDPTRLSSELSQLLQDKASLQQLAKDGRVYAHRNFRWSVVADKLCSIYAEVLHPTRGKAE
ncbi:glycosyltransferase [Pseudonocardia oroxyli]|uniref:Glycosyltransferase involved in cell wall bisynthesis n=1 Tax=Pseudonocardia oroxyli TaxID=366584 RepID=A0A1G7ZAD5_PSEOR|nr:glycosyltransferase [Pseudonocardia oroxyli]SDH05722.1 Glycosyltransferase involved in cell wall bisynthesis [Pseudonocardia oroxyli]